MAQVAKTSKTATTATFEDVISPAVQGLAFLLACASAFLPSLLLNGNLLLSYP